MSIGWLPEGNLQLFLQRLSEFTGYAFADWDWDAVRFGLRDTDEARNVWYEYPLMGTPPVQLAFARLSPARILVRWQTEEALDARIEALVTILQHYPAEPGTQDWERLMERAFAEVAAPEEKNLLRCNAAHLKHCPECQDAQATFRGKHWKDLLGEETQLPSYNAGPILLQPEARRYFLPAYLIAALRERDSEWVEIGRTGLPDESFTVLQRELLHFLSHQLKPERSV
jgi:hypothetical protein